MSITFSEKYIANFLTYYTLYYILLQVRAKTRCRTFKRRGKLAHLFVNSFYDFFLVFCFLQLLSFSVLFLYLILSHFTRLNVIYTTLARKNFRNFKQLKCEICIKRAIKVFRSFAQTLTNHVKAGFRKHN